MYSTKRRVQWFKGSFLKFKDFSRIPKIFAKIQKLYKHLHDFFKDVETLHTLTTRHDKALNLLLHETLMDNETWQHETWHSLILLLHETLIMQHDTMYHPESTFMWDNHWLQDITEHWIYIYTRHSLITRHDNTINLLLHVTLIDNKTWHHIESTSTWDTHW